jgi:hypothetical protein
MTLKFWCAQCGRAMSAQADQAQATAKCPGCGSTQKVPVPASSVHAEAGNKGQPSDPPASVYQLAAPQLERQAAGSVALELAGPSVRSRRRQKWELIQGSALDPSQLQGPSVILICLSIADVLITYMLLRTSQAYYESNPIAYWFFARWNIRGMIVFKFAAIGLAIASGEIIERQRPGRGRLVLWIGCVAATAVVWHGLRLYMGLPGLPMVGKD